MVHNKISCQRIPPINGYGEVITTTGFERKTKIDRFQSYEAGDTIGDPKLFDVMQDMCTSKAT
jgi:hypothetical protein